MKRHDDDRVNELLNEWDMVKDDLDSNELEQSVLRSIERGLEEQKAKIEKELEDLGVEY